MAAAAPLRAWRSALRCVSVMRSSRSDCRSSASHRSCSPCATTTNPTMSASWQPIHSPTMRMPLVDVPPATSSLVSSRTRLHASYGDVVVANTSATGVSSPASTAAMPATAPAPTAQYVRNAASARLTSSAESRCAAMMGSSPPVGPAYALARGSAASRYRRACSAHTHSVRASPSAAAAPTQPLTIGATYSTARNSRTKMSVLRQPASS